MNRDLEQDHMNFCLDQLYGHRRVRGVSQHFGFSSKRVTPNSENVTSSSSFASLPTLGQDKVTFIEKVLKILDDAPKRGFEEIVCWEPTGLSFKVHKIKEFEQNILPEYLQQTKLRSFQRQLIKHGFTRIQGGSGRGAYQHPKFLRDNRKSCLSIQRLGKNQDSDDKARKPPVQLELGTMSSHFKRAVEDSRPSFKRAQKSSDGDNLPREEKLEKSMPSGSDHSSGSICPLITTSGSRNCLPDSQALSPQLDLHNIGIDRTPTTAARNLTAAFNYSSSSRNIPLVSVEALPRESLSNRFAGLGMSGEPEDPSLGIRIFAPSLEPKSLGKKFVHIPPISETESLSSLAAKTSLPTKLQGQSDSSLETFTNPDDDLTPLDITAEVQCDMFWGL